MFFGSFRQICQGKYHLHHDICFNGVRHVHFLKSEWESYTPANKISIGYLAYRIGFMILITSVLIFSLVCTAYTDRKFNDGGLNFYMVFLTHWSIITQVIYGISYAVYLIVLKMTNKPPWIENEGVVLTSEYVLPKEVPSRISGSHASGRVPSQQRIFTGDDQNVDPNKLHSHFLAYYRLENDEEVAVAVFERAPGERIVVEPLPIMDKIIWYQFNCTTVLPTFVTLGYWGFLYTEAYLKLVLKMGWCGFPSGVMVHGLNTLMFFVDFMVVGIPFRLGHVTHVCIYGFIYATFTGLYDLAGGAYLDHQTPYFYPFLNWHETPGAALTAMYLAIGLAIFIFVLNTILYSFRLWLVSKCKPGAQHEHDYKFDWIRRPKKLGKSKKYCNCFSKPQNEVRPNLPAAVQGQEADQQNIVDSKMGLEIPAGGSKPKTA